MNPHDPRAGASLIERIIDWSARNRFLVFTLVAVLLAIGVHSI